MSTAGSRRKLSRSRQRLAPPWILIVPALLIYTFVTLYPAGSGALYAFTDWNGLAQDFSFVGLENFRELLNDPQAVGSLRNTVLLTVVTVVFQTVTGLLLAMALNSDIKSRNFLRAIFFAPVVLTPLILAFLWQYIYSQGGVLNRILALIGLEGLQQNWLGNPSVALWSIVGLLIWQYTGFSMVIFLAGLQGIPEELYDAAAVDGAGTLQRFWNITVPMLAPAITIAVVLATIIHLRTFDQVLAMTFGGPGYATETLSTLLYKQAFVQGNYAYSTATALVLTMLVCAVALVQLKILRSQEVEA